MLTTPTYGEAGFGSLKTCNPTTDILKMNNNIHTRMGSLAESLLWHEGAQLTGMIVKEDEEGFFLILKASKRGKPVVHFTGGRSFFDAIEALLWEVEHGLVDFRPDKYAK